jgi:type IV pilus assembly protein PilY1
MSNSNKDSSNWQIFKIFALVLCLANGSFAKSPPPGTGYQDVKTNVIFIQDVSGSMGDAIPCGVVKYPFGIAFDSSGNIYLASKDNATVTKYDSSGGYVSEWGGYSYFPSNKTYNYIYAIASANVGGVDYIYIADQNNGRIVKTDTSGNFISSTSMSTASMKGIAVSRDGSLIYAIDNNGKVNKFNGNGVLQGSIWTNSPAYMVALDSSGNVYITQSDKKIKKFNSSGTLQMTIPSSGSLAYTPSGIAVDLDGKIYATDYTNGKIYAYNSTGVAASPATYGSSGAALGKWKNPAGIAVDSSGNVWIADYNNNRIQGLNSNLLVNSPTSCDTKIVQARKVIQDIVSNSNLSAGANFGLIKFSGIASLVVPVSSSGGTQIYNSVGTLFPNGTTMLDTAMQLARKYLSGTLYGKSSPIIPGAWCQNTVLVVISDGEWFDSYSANADAKYLYDTYGVKTYAIGFHSDASSSGIQNYIDLSNVAGTYPTSPVFANDWEGVYLAASQFISQAISTNLTFSAPTILPGITTTDSILQATFKQEATHQWEGYFNKYSLNADGSVGSLQWEAGQLLALVPAANRNIWTVATGLSNATLNNFTTSEANYSALHAPINENLGTPLTDAAAQNLINFVRGVDVYNEFNNATRDYNGGTILAGERWKLSDIYHSQAIAVGAPNAVYSASAASNTESYYRAQNAYGNFISGSTCGGQCSLRTQIIYVGGNDGMLHAFNAATGAEIWAFIPPSLIPNLQSMISGTSGQSISIYGVDESPVVKDIYYGGSWHTVLICGLRQGGHSYFALDVTNPNQPQHLFTINYNVSRNLVNYWAADGTRADYTASNVPDAFNFFTLGEAWSTPVIARLPVGASGAMKWAAIIGGGFNGATNTSYGAQLFLLDMENGGQIIKNMPIGDTLALNGIVNSVPPMVTSINGDSTASFQANGAIVYLSDLEGILWKINLTDSGTIYNTTKMFNAGSTSTNARLSFQPTAASLDTNGTLWQYYGTGDVQNLGNVNAGIANQAYGIKDADFPNYTPIPNAMTTANMANLTGSSTCPTNSQNGWYINLAANQSVTAKATITNKEVILPMYAANNNDICVAGVGSISEVDYTCGTIKRTINLGAGVPTQAVIYKNKMYVGISTNQTNSGGLANGFTQNGNLIVGTPLNTATGKVHIESWQELF